MQVKAFGIKQVNEENKDKFTYYDLISLNSTRANSYINDINKLGIKTRHLDIYYLLKLCNQSS